MFGRTAFETDEPEVAAEVLSDAYAEMALTMGDDEAAFRFELERFDAGPFQLDEMAIGARARFGFVPEEEFFVSRVIEGRLGVRQPGWDEDELFVPGEIALAGRADVEMETEVGIETEADPFAQKVLILRASAVREAAGLEPDAETPRFTSSRAISPHRARTWKRARDFVHNMLEVDPDVATAPLVIGSANRMLAGLLLATFPNQTTAPPLRRDDHDARRPGTLHRAIAFIESNADLDIDIGDIAAAAEVSRRAIQLAFRRHLDTTPTAYLRRVRLDFAHAELIAGSPVDLTVTEVAYRWGFSSPSRFAERYRVAFGLSPSETLRR
jgi:AraC-like DNA-binding protein